MKNMITILFICVIFITHLSFPCYAISQSNDKIKVLNGQAWELIKQKKYSEAMAICEGILNIDNNNSVALSYRGYLYNKKGKNELALKDCEKSVKIDQKNKFGWYALGATLSKRGQRPLFRLSLLAGKVISVRKCNSPR